jgi:hypothetical protein
VELLRTDCRGSVEERAQWFENHNNRPISFVQAVCARETRPCKYCNKLGAPKFCSKCSITVYCDATCQGRDWSCSHKKTCRPIREIFHIRSAIFGHGIESMHIESNMVCTLLDGGLTCNKCNQKRVDERPCLTFYKGFTEFRLKCRTCHTERLTLGSYGTGDVPFATNSVDFMNQLKEINKKQNHFMWLVF